MPLPLTMAVVMDDAAMVRVLLEGGADPNLAPDQVLTPLMLAASRGDGAIVQSLLAADADVNAAGKDGSTPLDLAKNAGHTSIVSLLETAGGLPGAPQPWPYQDDGGRFRLQLPPGWHQQERPDAVAGFANQDGTMAAGIQRAGAIDPEDFIARFTRIMEAVPMEKVSEEIAVVSGLPARKLVFRLATPQGPHRMWAVVVLSEADVWTLILAGPENDLSSPESDSYQ
jgi:hypothetical protein